MAFDTAGNIIADAAVELGLVSYAQRPTTIYGSQDANIGLLCQMLKTGGRDISREYAWSMLSQTATLSTVASQGRYQLPVDFDRVLDSTAWNRSNRIALGGPMSLQQFSALKAQMAGTVFSVIWTVLQGQVQLYPDTSTPGSQLLAFMYQSRWWVVPAAIDFTYGATSTPGLLPAAWQNNTTYATDSFVTNAGNIYAATVGGTSSTVGPSQSIGTFVDGGVTWTWQARRGRDAPAQDTDIIRFDAQLVLRMLIRNFRRAKGMDSTAADQAYADAFEAAKSADRMAGILSLTPGNAGMLSDGNIPLTGFGS